jgi:hypothetical protein
MTGDYIIKQPLSEGEKRETVSARPRRIIIAVLRFASEACENRERRRGDEDWQLSKDSADAATAVSSSSPISTCEVQKMETGETVRRQRESKKRNQNRNRGSLVTVSTICISAYPQR